jgi:hypothetical protein
MREEIAEYLRRESARERKVMARERGEGKQCTEGETRRCRMCNEKRKIIEHMWNGCSEMGDRERKERGEILNGDGREIGWMQGIWKRRDRMEKERGRE